MSRTYRDIPADIPRRKGMYITRERDGKRNISLELRRDDRVAGLREHKQERAGIRQQLLIGPEADEHPRAGKMRRYTRKYGAWEY